MTHSAFGHSHPGRVRPVNQDRILLDPRLGLYLLADGVGGLGHGEEAAELAVSAAHYAIKNSKDGFDASWPFGFDVHASKDENRLRTALLLANQSVRRRAKEREAEGGKSMGSTLVAVLVDGGAAAASIAHVGDSRCYLLREGVLERLTEDHSWVADMIRAGAITPEQAASHPMRNVLLQSIGTQEDAKVSLRRLDLREGDTLMLTSDGVHGVVGEAALRSMLYTALYAAAPAEEASRKAIEMALSAGAPDNASCIVVRV
jgi:protein phosphatase